MRHWLTVVQFAPAHVSNAQCGRSFPQATHGTESVLERPTERQLPIEGSSGFRLLVVFGPRAETFSLPASGEVVIGRGAECQIRIDDARLSRSHAVLEIGNGLTLRDMGSANGCHVAGRQLQPNESVPISPGVVILLGGVTLVIQRGHASTRLRHVRSHDYFEARVEDECARAEASKSIFSMARIRCRAKSSAKVEAILARWLRPMDIVALYAPLEYELLLIDTAAESARQLCEAIIIELGEDAVGLAVCSFPRDARSPEGLSRELAGVPVSEDTSSSLDHLGPDLALVARGSISVLLLGETGVGKEVAAGAIHRNSPRAKQSLVSINCAAFSETLLESELFGHERGAFTGAHKTKVGLIESADGGTFFLDEVGEMPPSLQVKLLRVLEQKQVMKIGALRPRSIDVRFIAATNRDLEAEVARGAFRRDLYYRLAAATVMIPPLRDRRDEIVGLAQRFIAHVHSGADGREMPRLSAESREILESYAWPGNIRELRNVIERAVLLCRDGRIRPEHLPTEKMGRVLPPVLSKVVPSSRIDVVTQFEPPPADDDGRLGQRDSVVDALARCAGNQTQAARYLGVSRRTFVKRLEEFALPRPRKQMP
jgi:DNA-binding NtrC family response regulator/pSer/pThr/pTyr-binding forkhead associated (FHA) protein